MKAETEEISFGDDGERDTVEVIMEAVINIKKSFHLQSLRINKPQS